MKILLLGGSGQLGLEVQSRAQDLDFEVISPVKAEVDISQKGAVEEIAERISADLIINCAAYTAVDKAETDQDAAYRLNCDGAENAALAAKAVGCRLIHISTDYVFDGNTDKAISELITPNPINVYGLSKLAGERKVSEILKDKGLIVRTSSLHGSKGENFVHTMVRLFKEKKEVKVVNDQFMSPTWAGWLAETLLDLGRLNCSGILHASCTGATSWFDFASKILSFVRDPLLLPADYKIEPVSWRNFIRPAKRPIYSVFDTTKLSSLIGRTPIRWDDGLYAHLSEMGIVSARSEG